MMINVIQTSHKCKVTVTIKKKIERNRCTHIWMHANVKAFWYNQLSTHYFLLINNNSLNVWNVSTPYQIHFHQLRYLWENEPIRFCFPLPLWPSGPCDPQALWPSGHCDPQASVTLTPLWPSSTVKAMESRGLMVLVSVYKNWSRSLQTMSNIEVFNTQEDLAVQIPQKTEIQTLFLKIS